MTIHFLLFYRASTSRHVNGLLGMILGIHQSHLLCFHKAFRLRTESFADQKDAHFEMSLYEIAHAGMYTSVDS